MRYTLNIVFIFISLSAFPTAQISDILIREGDTLTLFSTPLEFKPGIEDLRIGMFDFKDHTISTGCWRGYMAFWKIENDSLFLTKIISCLDNNLIADLDKLFPLEVKQGKIFASWYTGELAIQKGDLLYYVHSGFESIYKREEVIQISNGVYQSTQDFQNEVILSEFWQMKPKKVRKHTYGAIEWSNLPPVDDKNIQTFLQFTIDSIFMVDTAYSYMYVYRKKNGEIDKEIITDLNNPFMKETIRIAKNIPSWDYFEIRGVRKPNSFSLVFLKKK